MAFLRHNKERIFEYDRDKMTYSQINPTKVGGFKRMAKKIFKILICKRLRRRR